MDQLTAKQARQRVAKDARRRVKRFGTGKKPRAAQWLPRAQRFTAALEAHFALNSKPLLAWRKRIAARGFERELERLRELGKAA